MNETAEFKLPQQQLLAGMEKLSIDSRLARPIMQYLQLLQKWNQAYNLTAIKDISSMVVHHALDALTVCSFIDPQDNKLIDVGTGGGVPGVLLALVYPDLQVSLLDAVGKKARFLRQVKRQLSLSNVTVIHDRVEKYSPHCPFDVIISRAFAEVNLFLSISKHLGDKNSRFLAMKGKKHEPLKQTSSFVQIQQHDLQVPFLEEQRTLYQFRIKWPQISTKSSP